MNTEFWLRVRGPRALWCIPHFRADPYSYSVMTPSAARGLACAIYWKPEFEWEIAEILVLAPILHDTTKMKSVRTVAGGPHTLQVVTMLVNVDYAVRLRMVENPLRPRLGGHGAEFLRRVRRGQHFTQPYLGRREFTAEWSLVEDVGELPPPIPVTQDLGSMLLDLFPVDLGVPGGRTVDQFETVFWRAGLDKGVMHVPEKPWEERRDRTFRVRNRAHSRAVA
jgi:CRISPR-associated protein Cas5d